MESLPPTSNSHAAFHLCQINNESVEWMSQGDFQAAFYHLQDAVRLVSGILSHPTSKQEKQDDPGSPRQDSLVQTHLRYLDVELCEEFGASPKHQLCSANILSLPFVISKIPQRKSKACHDHCFIQSVASVAIFNMGMTLFLQSQLSRTYRSREGLLERAFFLYHQAATLADEGSQIYLACCHNMVDISVHWGDLVEAQKWRSRIRKAADTIGESWGIFQQAVCIYHSGTVIASRAA